MMQHLTRGSEPSLDESWDRRNGGGKEERTLVVEVQLVLVIRHSLIILKVFPQLLIVGDCSVQRLAGRKTLPQLGAFLADLGILQEERSAVEVISPLPVLPSLFR